MFPIVSTPKCLGLQLIDHFLSFRSFAQLTGLGGGGGGWSDWFLRSELVAYLGLGEASTALWMSREKFSAPTTEERYEERCILRQVRLSVDARSEKYLEMIWKARSIAEDVLVFFCAERWLDQATSYLQ